MGYGPKLVARDKTTGDEIAAIDLLSNPQGAPMSYSVGGKHYIAVSVSSVPVPQLVVLALPDQAI